MATEDIYLSGKGKWIRAHQPNQWDKWAMVLYPNNESLEKIRELQARGLKNVIKKDEDGYNVQFSRPLSKLMKGKVQAFTPPKVLDKDGLDLGNLRVGNGSDVTVKVQVYEHKTPTGKAIAARWEAVRIDNLVPFEVDKDFQDDEKEQIAGLKDQPEQLF